MEAYADAAASVADMGRRPHGYTNSTRRFVVSHDNTCKLFRIVHVSTDSETALAESNVSKGKLIEETLENLRRKLSTVLLRQDKIQPGRRAESY